MLVKQSYRVHQISLHVAKKEKRLYPLNLQKLIVLHFDVNNQEENQFGVNEDFTINTLTMAFCLWLVFLPCFFHSLLVIRNTCIDISFLYYNVLNYTPRWFFIFRLMFRMYNRNIETLDVKKTGRNMKNLGQVKASVTSIPSEHRCTWSSK